MDKDWSVDETINQIKHLLLEKDAEILRLRGALKTFANNVKETNEGIDESWAKTIYPLKAENQRLREICKELLQHAEYMLSETEKAMEKDVTLLQKRISRARAALKDNE